MTATNHHTTAPADTPSSATAGQGKATTFTTPSDCEIAVTRVVDAPRSLVWEVWTSPKHLPHWLLGPDGWTMPVCEIDLRPGGAWRMVWRQADGTEMEMKGEYREVTPPERVVSTESWGPEWPETINTVTLTEQGARTTIAQTTLYPSKEARDAAMKTGMMDGMAAAFTRLDGYLETQAR
ncbi:MAG: SRPBCC family protein [Chloroflexi bacterium]|nr:SRPBCC family protein [Chloroflexota bacterium]